MKRSPRLAGKVAIVTGAARGQGAEEARLFVAEGARVVIGDVLANEGEQLAKEFGGAARFVRMDVSQEADWDCTGAEFLADGGATAGVFYDGVASSFPRK